MNQQSAQNILLQKDQLIDQLILRYLSAQSYTQLLEFIFNKFIMMKNLFEELKHFSRVCSKATSLIQHLESRLYLFQKSILMSIANNKTEQQQDQINDFDTFIQDVRKNLTRQFAKINYKNLKKQQLSNIDDILRFNAQRQIKQYQDKNQLPILQEQLRKDYCYFYDDFFNQTHRQIMRVTEVSIQFLAHMEEKTFNLIKPMILFHQSQIKSARIEENQLHHIIPIINDEYEQQLQSILVDIAQQFQDNQLHGMNLQLKEKYLRENNLLKLKSENHGTLKQAKIAEIDSQKIAQDIRLQLNIERPILIIQPDQKLSQYQISLQTQILDKFEKFQHQTIPESANQDKLFKLTQLKSLLQKLTANLIYAVEMVQQHASNCHEQSDRESMHNQQIVGSERDEWQTLSSDSLLDLMEQQQFQDEAHGDYIREVFQQNLIKFKEKVPDYMNQQKEHIQIKLRYKILKEIQRYSLQLSAINQINISPPSIQFLQTCRQLIQLLKNNEMVKEYEYQLIKIIKKDWCQIHQLKVYYICHHQYYESKKYLCNQCINQINTTKSHINHEILCKQHGDLIKHKMQAFDQENNQQIYQCNFCLNIKHYLGQISLILKCHYTPITHICLQENCIKKQRYLLCPSCNQSQHQGHNVRYFSKRSLMEKNNLNCILKVSQYQNLYIKIKQQLKLGLFSKVIHNNITQMWFIFGYIESFMTNNKDQVEKWINQIIKNGQKENVSVLWGIDRLCNLNLSEQQREFYIQILHDSIQVQLQRTYQQVNKVFSNFRVSIQSLMHFSLNDIREKLNKKYKQISIVEENGQLTVCPYSLELINIIHYDKIQNITILKKSQQSEDWQKADKRKIERQIFFKQLRNKLSQFSIPNEAKNKIFDLFINFGDDNTITIEMCKYQLGDLSQYEQIIKKISSELTNIQNNYKITDKICKQIAFIDQNKFKHLRKIKISFSINQFDKVFSCNLSISAFAVFRIIYNNEQLSQFTIKGVYVLGFIHFRKYLRILQNNLEHDYTAFNQSHMIYSSTNRKNRKVYLLSEKQKDESYWIKIFNPPKKLYLSLDSRYSFSKYNEQTLSEQLKDWQYFSHIFPDTHNLSFCLEVTFDNTSILAKILEMLTKLADISLLLNIENDYQFQILGQNTPITLFFSYLCKIPSIKEIMFCNFRFNKNIQREDYLCIEKSLQTLFRKNAISYFELYQCYLFPALPAITNLQSFYFANATFCNHQSYIDQIIHANPTLNAIKIESIQKPSNLNLQHLKNLQIMDLNKSTQLSDSSLNSLSQQACRQLQILALYNPNETNTISQASLSKILPRLTVIYELYFENIDIDGDSLLSIPSPYLKKLRISNCKQITNDDIEGVDRKWGELRELSIRNCVGVSGRIFSICAFRALIELRIDINIMNESKYLLNYIKKRGIKVNIWK